MADNPFDTLINFVPDKINPDYRLADQYSRRAVRGETLLRRLDQANGSRPVLLTLAPENVKSVSERGLVLQIPGDGILRMVIPMEHVRCSITGVVQVELFDRWNYAFQSAVGYQSIKGSLLRAYLGSAPMTPEQSLQSRINAMERRAAVNRIDYMTSLLWTLKNEGIERMEDFTQTREAINGQLQVLRQRMTTIRGDIQAGKKIVASLEAIAELRELHERREVLGQRNPWRGQRFYAAHKKELDAYDWAHACLTRQGIPLDLDPGKAEAVVEQRMETLEELAGREARLRERLERLETAEREVRAAATDQSPTRERREKAR